MKRAVLAALAAIFIFSVFSSSVAKEPGKEQVRFYRPDYGETSIDIPGYEPGPKLMAAAAVDTYCVVWYDFETADWQSWTLVDNTAPVDTFFHVDDFAGLGGGSWGRLVPIEGTKSVWCGIRPGGGNDLYTCSWGAAPGYGNNWDEYFAAAISHDPGHLINVSYHLVCDTESGADLVTFEYANEAACGFPCCDWCVWNVLETHSGVVDTIVTHEIYSDKWGTKLRFRFQSDGAWSDQDGHIDTDGACIIDSITIWDDEGLIDYEDFENYSVGETYCGIWRACVYDAFGPYGSLAAGLESKDPCGLNNSAVIMFFNGSIYPSADYPGLYDTPYCTGAGGIESPCQDEMVVSPPIDLTRYSTGRDGSQDAAIPPGELASLGGVNLKYDAYVDLPLSNLVFRTWRMRNVEDGCPELWQTPSFWIPYEPNRRWITDTEDISFLVTSDTIQVALGVVDMCSEWYGTYGDCARHTPTPWYDNVRVLRYYTGGPQWSVRRIDLFQDTFPQDSGEMESHCRADMANDIAPGDELDRIDPGDSAVVAVAAPLAGGLDTLATGEARVFCHVNATFLGPDGKPDLFGPQLEGTYGSYVSDDGDWTILLCEPARSPSGVIAPDRYCIDLNDSLFTRGYMIEYYFKAFAASGGSSTWPAGAEAMPQSAFFGTSNLLEFTCLPTLRGDKYILYVDDCDGRGSFQGVVQNYYDYAFRDMWWNDDEVPDRYDVNGPSSAVSNGIGAYTEVSDGFSVFSQAYNVVIFDSGDLESCTISDGTEDSDKSDDAKLLIDWIEESSFDVSLLIMGDGVASDLSNSSASYASYLMVQRCGVSLGNGSYFEMTGGINGGGIASPLVSGAPDGPVDFLDVEYYASGGCPVINDFDVLEATYAGLCALMYPGLGDQQYCAGIASSTYNQHANDVFSIWVGHSFMNIRSAESGLSAWRLFLRRVFGFFRMDCPGCFTYTDSEIPKATSLSDNFPNPFNPVTRVKFSLKEKGHVKMRVYDVSGRLIRVLVNEVRDAGSYEISWDGTNGLGNTVASGIYFCRMEAADYERTLKMVLLR